MDAGSSVSSIVWPCRGRCEIVGANVHEIFRQSAPNQATRTRKLHPGTERVGADIGRVSVRGVIARDQLICAVQNVVTPAHVVNAVGGRLCSRSVFGFSVVVRPGCCPVVSADRHDGAPLEVDVDGVAVARRLGFVLDSESGRSEFGFGAGCPGFRFVESEAGVEGGGPKSDFPFSRLVNLVKRLQGGKVHVP